MLTLADMQSIPDAALGLMPPGREPEQRIYNQPPALLVAYAIAYRLWTSM